MQAVAAHQTGRSDHMVRLYIPVELDRAFTSPIFIVVNLLWLCLTCTLLLAGYGQVFPSLSPRSSGAGDTEFEWTMAEEKILRVIISAVVCMLSLR
jgi:hypothetical protein